MIKIKSYTDVEQSRKLVEILPLESADMSYHHFVPDLLPEGYCISTDKVKYETDIPCWSLSALLSALPEIQGDKPIITLYDNYITYPHISDLHTKADTLVDACYEIIIKLHELNLL